jgi:hypothetical protein
MKKIVLITLAACIVFDLFAWMVSGWCGSLSASALILRRAMWLAIANWAPSPPCRYPACASSSRRGWDPRLGFGSTGPPELSVMHVGTAAQAVRKPLVEPAKQADGLSRRRYQQSCPRRTGTPEFSHEASY